MGRLPPPYRVPIAMIVGCVLFCAAVLFWRQAREKKIEQSVRAAEMRLAQRPAQGLSSNRLDNLFAGADQYLWLSHETLGSSTRISVRVDASITRALFMIETEAAHPHVTLLRPGGKPVDLKSPDVFRPAIAGEQVTEIKRPAPGDWIIAIQDSGDARVAVRAESARYPISIERADIIPAQHAPAAPISVEAIRCCNADVPAEVHIGARGPLLSEVKIVLMSLDGKPLLVLKPESAGRTPRSLKGEYDYAYSAHFAFPRGPFYVMLDGVENGQGPCRRFSPELFEPIAYRD